MSTSDGRPRFGGGGIAADFDNLELVILMAEGWNEHPTSEDDAVLDSARAFVAFLRNFATLVEHEATAEAVLDRRQPGAVPGPEPGALRHAGAPLLTPHERVLDTLGLVERPIVWEPEPEPAYRAPLEGTVPPEGREWRCASCARVRPEWERAGYPSECACGGEWVLVELEP